jgi:lysophospholipase L1-like esterase
MPFALETDMQELQASRAASQFIEGLEYPISKSAIVAAAREADLNMTVQDGLKKLPDREYVDTEDLTRALNAS